MLRHFGRLFRKSTSTPRERGAAVIEFALVSLILIPLAIGTAEFGYLIQKKQLLGTAVRAGSRVAANSCLALSTDTSSTDCSEGSRPWDDYKILQAVRGSLGGHMNDVEFISVYRGQSSTDGSTPPGGPIDQCKNPDPTANGVAQWCNIYRQDAFALLSTLTSTTASTEFNCTPTGRSTNFCPVPKLSTVNWPGRARGFSNAAYVGVYVKLRHKFATGLFGHEKGLTEYALFRLEPSPLADRKSVM